MRLLAIDYGTTRTGIAVSDPLQLIAGGLCTVPTGELLAFLCRYVKRESVERFVLGWPVQPAGGRPSENMPRVEAFARKLHQALPHIPIVRFDERYTSSLAHASMLRAGLPRSKRRDKALVDEVAATIILQDYMESQRRGEQR